VEGAVDALVKNEALVRNVSVTPAADIGLVCDRENLELLLRLTHKKTRPVVRERPVALLTPIWPYVSLRLSGQSTPVPGLPPGPVLFSVMVKLEQVS
jgi:hypothetical protein